MVVVVPVRAPRILLNFNGKRATTLMPTMTILGYSSIAQWTERGIFVSCQLEGLPAASIHFSVASVRTTCTNTLYIGRADSALPYSSILQRYVNAHSNTSQAHTSTTLHLPSHGSTWTQQTECISKAVNMETSRAGVQTDVRILDQYPQHVTTIV